MQAGRRVSERGTVSEERALSDIQACRRSTVRRIGLDDGVVGKYYDRSNDGSASRRGWKRHHKRSGRIPGKRAYPGGPCGE